jgi:signal transduction histidine kinase
MLFLTSLSQIIVSVAFAYSLVMFDYIHTNERMVQQERLAFIGLMDAKLTHDLRSFIVIQRNLSDTILKQLRSNKTEDAIQLTEEMQSNTNQTLALISAIRDELKQLKPHYSFAKIEEMVDEAVEMIKLSNIKNINIKKKFSQNLPPIRVEKTRFVSALVNLLQNAVDSFDESGNVVCLNKAANTIEISGTEKDGEITLTISDNGCGIPQDKKDRIFESFYSTKEGNTGLGLFTVKQEIQRYNGDITCLSEPSIGTTMIITLPAEEDNSDPKTGT